MVSPTAVSTISDPLDLSYVNAVITQCLQSVDFFSPELTPELDKIVPIEIATKQSLERDVMLTYNRIVQIQKAWPVLAAITYVATAVLVAIGLSFLIANKVLLILLTAAVASLAILCVRCIQNRRLSNLKQKYIKEFATLGNHYVWVIRTTIQRCVPKCLDATFASDKSREKFYRPIVKGLAMTRIIHQLLTPTSAAIPFTEFEKPYDLLILSSDIVATQAKQEAAATLYSKIPSFRKINELFLAKLEATYKRLNE